MNVEHTFNRNDCYSRYRRRVSVPANKCASVNVNAFEDKEDFQLCLAITSDT